MNPTLLRTLSRADRDFDGIVDFYIREAGVSVAEGFVTALDAAYTALRKAPRGGSPILGERMDLAGLRTWNVRGFPYLICYLLDDEAVVVWRIVHSQRDLPKALAALGD